MVLKWMTANVSGGGLPFAPFLIQWDTTSQHPSALGPHWMPVSVAEDLAQEGREAAIRLLRAEPNCPASYLVVKAKDAV